MDQQNTFENLSLYEIGVYFRDLHKNRTPELEYRNVKLLLEKHLGDLLTAHTSYIRQPDGIDSMVIHCPSARSQLALTSILTQTSEHLITAEGIAYNDVPSIITHGGNFDIAIQGEHAEAFMCKLMQHIHTAKVAQNPHMSEDEASQNETPKVMSEDEAHQNETAKVMSEINFRAVYHLLSHFKARGNQSEIDVG